MPEATASSTTIWIAGLSTTGRISLGMTFEAGSIRVPNPAANTTALRTFISNPRGDRGRLAGRAHPFARFLRGFAAYTESGHRARLEPRDPDLVTAFFAVSVDAAIDPREGLIDLGEQLPFAIAHPQQKIAVGFVSCAVGGIGE